MMRLSITLQGILIALAFVLPSIQATAWAQDTDGDGVPDTADNCRTLPNAGASACDTDADGYGNACDGDFNQDGATDGADFVDYFLPDFLSGVDRGIGSDMDCDGAVTGIDFATHFIANFSEGTPGPGRAPGASAMSPFGGSDERWTEPDSEPIHEVDPGVALSTSPRAGEEIELDLFEARLRRKQEVERWIDRVADAVVNRMSEEPARGGGLFGDTGQEFTEDPADQFIEEESADGELLGASNGALVDELPALEEAVRTRVAAIIAETPTDLELSPTSATLFSIADLGRALVGLTVLESPAIGLRDPWGERCETTVLRDVDTSSGRATLRRSPLIDFFEDVARPDDRRAMSRAVFALSRVQAGIRCLNGADLSALESAYARALTELLLRLRDGGRELAARAIWDHSLPVSLLFFDAVKAYKKPGTLALLRLPSDFWDSVSTIDDSAALPEMAFADTLAHRLYCVSPSDSLTLDRFGIWAPDWTADGQLQRIAGHIDGHTAWPCDILRSFTELERLGEGDCPLVEMVQTNMICRSPRTCDAKLRVRAEAGGSSGGPFGGFGPADSFGIGPEGSGAAAPSLVGEPTRPGMPGSRYSHLGTDRSSYSDDVCSTSAADTGGAGPTDCLGPPIRNSRGSFSRDPEMDALMRCTLDVLTTEGGRPIVASGAAETRAVPSPWCEVIGWVSQEDESEDGRSEEESEEQNEEATGNSPTEDAIQNTKQVLAGVGEHFDTEEFQDGFEAAVRSVSPDGTVNPDRDQSAGAVARATAGTLEDILSGRLRTVNGSVPAGSHGEWIPHGDGTATIVIDYDQIRREAETICGGDSNDWCVREEISLEISRTVAHEVAHHLIRRAEADGHFFTEAGANWIRGGGETPRRSSEAHHDITEVLGFGRQCDPENPLCGNECGQNDLILMRMFACVENDGGGSRRVDPRCTVDLCEDEEDYFPDGLMGGSCFALRDLPGDNPICRMVQCEEEAARSGAYAQCCGGGGGGHGGGGGSFPPGCGPTEEPRPGEDCGDFGGPPTPGG